MPQLHRAQKLAEVIDTHLARALEMSGDAAVRWPQFARVLVWQMWHLLTGREHAVLRHERPKLCLEPAFSIVTPRDLLAPVWACGWSDTETKERGPSQKALLGGC